MSDRLAKVRKWKWAILGGLVVAGVAVIAGATLALENFSISGLRDQVNSWMQSLGPKTFFALLAVAPAFGAPVSPFYLLAGSFGKTMAIVGCLTALTVNIALSYFLARGILHPMVEKLVNLSGRSIPIVKKEDQWTIALLLRITPGPPFFMQSYILALAGIPFGVYMAVSLPVVWAYAIGMIVVGESLMQGHAGQLVFGIALFVAVTLVIMIVRKKLRQRAAAAGLPVDIVEPGNNETQS